MRASIIIAAHNEGERLVRTVESVIESAGGLDYEIIVADDASDDGSIEETVRRFPRVRVVRHDPIVASSLRIVASSLRERASSRDTTTDLSRSESPRPRGCSPTKDLGARHARGEVLVFLDGHTLPEKDAIRRLVEDVERTGGQAIITPCIVGLDAERWKLNRSQRGHGYRLDLETMSAGWLPLSHLKPVRQGGRDFYESPAFIGCAFAISRELYDKLHGFDPHMFVWGVEDVDLALRCWLMGHPILHDPDPCIGHRFRRTFDNYEVPRQHVVANQIRMAYKCLSPSPFADWTDRARQRYSIALLDRPEGLFTAAWTQFESHRASAETQRAHLHARRVHDELWYAARFSLPWPRLAGHGLEPAPEMFALMEGSAPPVTVTLSIDGVAEEDKVTVGGLLIRRAESNNAPRKRITLSTTATEGSLTLHRNNEKVKLFTAMEGGDEVAFDEGKNKQYGVAELPPDLYVQGDEGSCTRRDVVLTLTLDGTETSDAVKFTVLWITMSANLEEDVSDNDAARENYSILRHPTSFELGFGMYVHDGVFEGVPNRTAMGIGIELIGSVAPGDFVHSEFNAPLRLNRDSLGGKFWGGTSGDGSDPHVDIPTYHDLSHQALRDDNAQPDGKVYDLDAPAVIVQSLVPMANHIFRRRENFNEWAECELDSTWIRCSTIMPWFTRMSIKLTGVFEMKLANSGTATTLKRDFAGWEVDQWAGGVVDIVAGVGAGQSRRVTSNSGDTLTVSRDWATVPTEASVYRIIMPNSWTKLDDVAENNRNGQGTTNVSWNLE
jgi:GT2 family glycosyltransferase